jgi:hypothetical protein
MGWVCSTNGVVVVVVVVVVIIIISFIIIRVYLQVLYNGENSLLTHTRSAYVNSLLKHCLQWPYKLIHSLLQAKCICSRFSSDRLYFNTRV